MKKDAGVGPFYLKKVSINFVSPSPAVILPVHHHHRRQRQRRQLRRFVVHVLIDVRAAGERGRRTRWNKDGNHFVVLTGGGVPVTRGQDWVVVQHEAAQIVFLGACESSEIKR